MFVARDSAGISVDKHGGQKGRQEKGGLRWPARGCQTTLQAQHASCMGVPCVVFVCVGVGWWGAGGKATPEDKRAIESVLLAMEKTGSRTRESSVATTVQHDDDGWAVISDALLQEVASWAEEDPTDETQTVGTQMAGTQGSWLSKEEQELVDAAASVGCPHPGTGMISRIAGGLRDPRLPAEPQPQEQGHEQQQRQPQGRQQKTSQEQCRRLRESSQKPTTPAKRARGDKKETPVKMDRKNVFSRAYHRELSAMRRQGVSEEGAKEFARVAAARAVASM